MPTYDIRPLQLRLLDILMVIHRMCEEHGLRYYLADGSLIGAVRHKGFIPWDDDMDICMPRPDYEQLILHAREWLPKRYEFVCFELDKNYPLHFGKVQDAESTLVERPHLYYLGGVYVDVFPIDGAPKCKLAQRLWNTRYKFLTSMLYLSYRDPYKHGHGPSSWMPLLVRHIMPMAGWQRAIKRCMMEYGFDQCQYVSFNHNDALGSMINKETVLGNPTPIVFEDKTVWGLKDNDSYLTQLFGDYMTPPPADKIHQHNFYYMDLDSPYCTFDKSLLQKDN